MRERKNFCTSPLCSLWILMEVGMLWRFVGLKNLLLIFSSDQYSRWLENKKKQKEKFPLMLVCLWTFMEQFFPSYNDDSHCWTLHVDPVWVILIFIQSQLFEKVETCALILLQSSQSVWMKCSVLAWPVGLVKRLLTLFGMIDTQWGKPIYIYCLYFSW